MINHFSCIGLRVNNQEDFDSLANVAIEKGRRYKRPGGGLVVVWSPEEGVEMWLQACPDRSKGGYDFHSADPHFNGKSRIPMRITGGCAAHDFRPCEGTLTGWPLMNKSDLESGAYPLDFASPDFDFARDRIKPRSISVFQVAAFAEDLECFANIEESSKKHPQIHETFIPRSAIERLGENESPNPRGFIGGTILSAKRMRNFFSGLEFFHLLVRSYAADYDVVAPIEMLEDCPPKVGGIAIGTFYFTGRLVGP